MPADAPQCALAAKAVDPAAPERIVEKRRAIARDARAAHFPPVHAVGRCQQLHIVIVPAGHLVASRSIGVVEVEPDRRGVAPSMRDDVGVADDVQLGLVPDAAVVRCGVAGVLQVAAHVPHLEELLARIVEHAVAEGHCSRIRSRLRPLRVLVVLFPLGRRRQHRIVRMVVGTMERSRQGRFFDEEVVDEQLSSQVDWHHSRPIDQVRRRYRRSRQAVMPRRPGLRETDAVVQRFRLASSGRDARERARSRE